MSMSADKSRRYIIAEEGNLYKMNLHCHTTDSDGKFTPEEIKRLYMDKGYSAVAYTDHRAVLPHTELTDADFVALTGVEMAFGIGKSTSVHICGISRDPNFTMKLPDDPDNSVEHINRGIEFLKSNNFITTLNHPRWSGMSYADISAIAEVDNIEVVNGFEMIQDGYGSSAAVLELELRRGRRARPLATDDSHRMSAEGGAGYEYFRGFTVAKASELTYSALIDAIDAGSFFASTGPLFHTVYLEGNILHVECSGVSGVYAHGELYSHRAAAVAKGDSIETVELDVTKICAGSSFLQVIIVDTAGRTAWSVPLWL